ncbi:Stress-related protein [Acorus gramineus]|uniref:Stress-related protein n=1 Tax=Acorus gramineus TaxID=55184 RepID=A0AAV9BNN9_ACOGR|nr:Stress-related protein [Acorus gramineus]
MADENQKIQIDEEETKLKYLDFVHVAAMQTVIYLYSVYSYAKENSGPLKPGVQTVEGTVKTVVGPVYERLHDVPYGLLRFADRKVDESVSGIERRVPEAVKGVATEVKRAGVVGTAKSAVARYEPAAERCAATAWRALNRLPVVPQVAQVVVPTAAHWAERYNEVVCRSAERGFAVSAYMPLVPTERIAKVFGAEGGEGVTAQ